MEEHDNDIIVALLNNKYPQRATHSSLIAEAPACAHY